MNALNKRLARCHIFLFSAPRIARLSLLRAQDRAQPNCCGRKKGERTRSIRGGTALRVRSRFFRTPVRSTVDRARRREREAGDGPWARQLRAPKGRKHARASPKTSKMRARELNFALFGGCSRCFFFLLAEFWLCELVASEPKYVFCERERYFLAPPRVAGDGTNAGGTKKCSRGEQKTNFGAN